MTKLSVWLIDFSVASSGRSFCKVNATCGKPIAPGKCSTTWTTCTGVFT